MQTVLAIDSEKNLTLISESFASENYATLGTGAPTYRVFKDNILVFESKNLLDAYYSYVHAGNLSIRQLPPESVLVVSNSRYSRQEKVFGVFYDMPRCANALFHKLHLFTKKNVDAEKAGINLLEFFYKKTSIDKKLLPYLKLSLIHCNQLIPQEKVGG